ncbi:MAG: DUF4012 domain-containing protein [Parcubacteria group bacterium]|nr:DUF4012 domain-containing protein [Parcubacteria group bacterium]
MKNGFLDSVWMNTLTSTVNLAPPKTKGFEIDYVVNPTQDVFRKYVGPRTLFKTKDHSKRIYINRPPFLFKNILRKSAIGLACVIIFCAILFKVFIFDNYSHLQSLGKEVYHNIGEGIASFKNLNFSEGKERLKNAQSSLSMLETTIDKASLFKIMYAPPFTLTKNLDILLSSSLDVANDVEKMTNQGLSDVFGRGIDLAKVKTIDKKIEIISRTTPKVIGSLADLSLLPGMGQWSSALKNQYFSIQNELNDSRNYLADLTNALGGDGIPKHYLIIFQNPSEIRATGGFWGSYMLLEVTRGKIASMDIRNIYDLDGQLPKVISPPKQLLRITPRWGTRDANWFFDFMTSATKGKEFFEQSRLISEKNIKVDVILGVNTTFVEELLKLTGPIPMPEYGIDITNENFVEKVQYAIEYGSDRSHFGDPKRILKIFIPRFLDTISATEDKKAIVTIIKSMFNNKDMQVAIFNPALSHIAEIVHSLGYDGHVIETSALEDYLAFVNSNVAGGKSDYVMTQKINARLVIKDDGIVEHNLTVTREHTGEKASFALWRSTNKDYIRTYVPLGAELIHTKGTTWANYPNKNKKATDDPLLASIETQSKIADGVSGIEEYPAEGKKVFGGWFNTPLGQQHQFSLQYKTKFLASYEYPAEGAVYRFIFQKQSGIISDVEIAIQAPEGYMFKETAGEKFNVHFTSDPKSYEIKLTIIPKTE